MKGDKIVQACEPLSGISDEQPRTRGHLTETGCAPGYAIYLAVIQLQNRKKRIKFTVRVTMARAALIIQYSSIKEIDAKEVAIGESAIDLRRESFCSSKDRDTQHSSQKAADK